MIRIFKILILLAIVLFVSCSPEELTDSGAYVGDQEVLAMLDFSHKNFDEVNITTKATLGLVPESRIQNMFLYIFVGNKRVYASYFDNNNRYQTKEDVSNAAENCWSVSNRSSNDPDDAETAGHIKIKAPVVSGGILYIMSNIDADMVNISPEKLNTVRTKEDVENLSASLNQEITSRNGYFPMSYKTSISIAENGNVTLGAPIHLERLDSKVMVNIRVATDNELETTEDGVTTKQTLKEFIPESWRVVNIPKGSYVFGRDVDFEVAGFFDTDPVAFETNEIKSFTYTDNKGHYHTVKSPVNGFSFYMLENREEAKASVDGNYHLREKRVKDPVSGKYVNGGNKWVYAPENGTYLEIKGEVIMTVDVSAEAKQQHLSANVTYYVHLGDFVHSQTNGVDAKDNYDVNRNTLYNYTITIKGVSEIEAEVSTSNMPGVLPYSPEFQENETGATGQVYIAKESIYTFDAHYGHRVFCFDADQVDAENITWYVKTPFGKEGVPEKVGDTEVPAGMDYKWVHFVLNRVTPEDVYSQENQPWPGSPYDDEKYDYYKQDYGITEDDLMDVVEFTQFIKDECRKYASNKESKFRKEFDEAWLNFYNERMGTSYTVAQAKSMTDDSYPWWRYRIYMTVFVDEFYYEKDPITGEVRDGLWKEFVNQPNRLMHILCDNMKSFDGESSATGSVITIRQHSIQTPYNLNNSSSGWGCETVDEFKDSYLWYFDDDETRDNPGMPAGYALSAKGNTSENNGLYNTAKLLGLTFNGSAVDKWDKYVDFGRVNDYKGPQDYNIYFLKEEYLSLLYSVLLRNRDNNGDGWIGPDELNWYQTSLEQVVGLYMGGLGLSDEAQLYPFSVSSQTGVFETGHRFSGINKWMLKIVSSTCRPSLSATLPVAVWAEEGVSISFYKQSYGWQISTQSPYSIRCARNLGLERPSVSNISNQNENLPEPLIKMERVGDDYRFNLANINEKSTRFYTTRELEPGDENSEMARLYSGFITGDRGGVSGGYSGLKSMLEGGDSPCPEGWRTPNVREGALMYLYCTDSNWWDEDANDTDNDTFYLISSYWSIGALGSKKKDKSTWYFGYNFASVEANSSFVRCVKDSDPSTW